MSEEKPHILYVEDHDDTRVVFELMLRHAGLDVTGVATGDKALDLAKGRRYDLILMDHVLPEASGAGLCRTIREFDKETPILFYSARAFPHEKQAAIDAGADGYLIKPDDLDRLIDRVWSLIEGPGANG